MFDLNFNTQQLLHRTALKKPFSEFLQSLQTNYPAIGSIQSYLPIMEGYEAANFILKCSQGRFVLKIFESDRQLQNIDNLIQILVEAPKVGVPTLELVPSKAGNLSIYSDQEAKVPYYLTKYWDGNNFEEVTPSSKDIATVTEYLARLNTLNFPVTEAYDAWSNKNLIKEYDAHSESLSTEIKEKIAEVVAECRQLDSSTFTKGVVHGDMQRKHVFKDSNGDYCILDFGCISNDAKVYDLSTYLAWFCLGEDNWENHRQIIDSVLSIYTKTHGLSSAEIKSLPSLIKAAYASYYLKTSQLIANGDTSNETNQWHHDSERLLDLAKSLKLD